MRRRWGERGPGRRPACTHGKGGGSGSEYRLGARPGCARGGGDGGSERRPDDARSASGGLLARSEEEAGASSVGLAARERGNWWMGSRADKADRKGQGCAACGMNLDSKSGSSAAKIFGIWSHGTTHAAGVLLV